MSNTNSKHTPLPWINGWGKGLTGPTTINGDPTVSAGGFDYIPISKGQETIGCVVQQDNKNGKEEMIANAELIVKAVNSHEELVNALKTILEENTHLELNLNGVELGEKALKNAGVNV